MSKRKYIITVIHIYPVSLVFGGLHMKNLQIAIWLFLVYSTLGWLLETLWWAVRKRTFANRGFLNGPVCSIYGIAALLMSVFLRDLQDHPFFLLLGCGITGAAVELIGGRVLEHLGAGRWWDYSGKRFQLGGYVSLGSTILWGLLGAVCMTWCNPLLIWMLQILPPVVRHLMLGTLAAVYSIDLIGSVLAVCQIRKYPRIKAANDRLESLSQRIGNKILLRVERRIQNAHPQFSHRRSKRIRSGFAQGCGYQKLFMLLLIGAFLGDLVETVFVRLTAGVWMSRSSLVWGQFSLVWGIALSGATAILYRYRDRSDGFLFVFGFFAGGVFEYFCSVFTELAFGTVFWDYSGFQFNLGGRINLLYCFFWGIAGVIWLKKLYPVFSRWIEKIPQKFGNAMVWVLTVFMIVNMAVTCGAMTRYNQRNSGVPAQNAVAAWIDSAFPDEWMEHRYQNMRFVQ